MRTYEVIDTIKTDLTEQVRYMFVTNDLPSDRDTLIYDLRETGLTAIDDALIYTSDIMDLWEDAGRPEPYELGMADTISESITHAVYEHLRDEAEEVIFDAVDEALDDLRGKILAGDIAYSWSEADEDGRAEIMADLIERGHPEDIFDALYNFRGQIEI